MPYEEVYHTADWCIKVKARDLSSLFIDSALGMNSLSGLVLQPEPVLKRSWSIASPDIESLLVAFLSELVFWMEQDKVGFNEFSLSIIEQKEQFSLAAELTGAPILSQEKQVKAVTFHNLRILQNEECFEARITFDV